MAKFTRRYFLKAAVGAAGAGAAVALPPFIRSLWKMFGHGYDPSNVGYTVRGFHNLFKRIDDNPNGVFYPSTFPPDENEFRKLEDLIEFHERSGSVSIDQINFSGPLDIRIVDFSSLICPPCYAHLDGSFDKDNPEDIERRTEEGHFIQDLYRLAYLFRENSIQADIRFDLYLIAKDSRGTGQDYKIVGFPDKDGKDDRSSELANKLDSIYDFYGFPRRVVYVNGNMLTDRIDAYITDLFKRELRKRIKKVS